MGFDGVCPSLGSFVPGLGLFVVGLQVTFRHRGPPAQLPILPADAQAQHPAVAPEVSFGGFGYGDGLVRSIGEPVVGDALPVVSMFT